MTPMRTDLLALFDRGELKKYLTEDELPALSESEPVTPEEAAR